MTKRNTKGKNRSGVAKSSPKTATGEHKAASSSRGGRSRTIERRQERQRQRRRQQQVAFVIGLVVIGIVVIVALIVANQPADAPIPDGVVARYEGIPQDATVEGFYRLGRPNAPVRVEEFASYSCPGCADFHEAALDGILELVREGKISFTFLPQNTAGANAEMAAQGAYCAGEQGAYWAFHDVLFDWQGRYGRNAFSRNRLVSGIDNMGLDTDQFNSCMGSSRASDSVDAGIAEGVERGIPGTPYVYVDGSAVEANIDAVRDAVETRLNVTGAVPIPLDSDEPVPETTPEATDEAALPNDEAEATDAPESTAEATESP